MKNYALLLGKRMFAFILVLLLSSFEMPKEAIFFEPLTVVPDLCPGARNEFEITINAYTEEHVKVYSFGLDGLPCTVSAGGRDVGMTDTLVVSRGKPLKLNIKFKMPDAHKPGFFTFKTNSPYHADNEVAIVYGYKIGAEEVPQEKKQLVSFSARDCKDNIRVYFPYGGTISTVSLYRDASMSGPVFKKLSYRFHNPHHYLVFRGRIPVYTMFALALAIGEANSNCLSNSFVVF